MNFTQKKQDKFQQQQIKGAQRKRKQDKKLASLYKNHDDVDDRKKDKKLVFLSKSVLRKVRERPMVTGTQIANEILEMYKKFCDVRIFTLTHLDWTKS